MKLKFDIQSYGGKQHSVKQLRAYRTAKEHY